MKLYWVTTEDHDEDWFVVAGNARQAENFHEDYEGYDRGDAVAEKVLDIPENIDAEKGHPSTELLQELGATFLEEGPTRIVEINGRKYCEGMLEAMIMSLQDDQFEEKGMGRPNETKKDIGSIH